MARGSSGAAYLAKAAESLAGAEREYAASAYNNCANRAYYACFQAAVAALIRLGIGPSPRDGQWRHDAVKAQFNEQAIKRRKLYASDLKTTFDAAAHLRAAADYDESPVAEIQAARVLRRAQAFVAAVAEGGRQRQ